MEVMWKVFSCEGNQYWFEKKLQGAGGGEGKVSTLPGKTELNLQQQKDRGDTDKACK